MSLIRFSAEGSQAVWEHIVHSDSLVCREEWRRRRQLWIPTGAAGGDLAHGWLGLGWRHVVEGFQLCSGGILALRRDYFVSTVQSLDPG